MNKCLNLISEFGTKHNLTFSSQEILKDSIVCLDGVHRKLLIVKIFQEVIYFSEVIDLKDVKSCSVKKQYGSIYGGALQTKKLDAYLETIHLNFEFVNGMDLLEVKFFHHIENHLSEMVELEKKAKQWEIMLSGMMRTSLEKTA